MTPLDQSNSTEITPFVYNIRMIGHGGEVVLGKISPQTYFYFKNNGVDVADYVLDEKFSKTIPEEVSPWDFGEWIHCDEIEHQSGIEMDIGCIIEIHDDSGNLIWKSTLDPASLEELGCEVVCNRDVYASDQKENTTVFYGQTSEKGLYFEGKINTCTPFDLSKLKFTYTDVEGWSVCSNIEYDNEYIDNRKQELESTDSYFAFIRILSNGDTESYCGIENDIDELFDEDDWEEIEE